MREEVDLNAAREAAEHIRRECDAMKLGALTGSRQMEEFHASLLRHALWHHRYALLEAAEELILRSDAEDVHEAAKEATDAS